MKLPEFLGKGRGGVQIFALPLVHYGLHFSPFDILDPTLNILSR